MTVLALLRNPWVLLLIACVAGIGGTGYYKLRFESCIAARAEEKASAERAARAAEEKAQQLSDDLLKAQAAALAANNKTVTVYRDRVINAPSTNTCGPAVRDAVDGVRAVLGARGGADQTQRGPAEPVR